MTRLTQTLSARDASRDRMVREMAAAVRDRLGGTAIEDEREVWRYACSGVVPGFVARPRSAEEVCELVSMTRQRSCGMVVVGHGTHLGIGFPPQRYDVALSTRELQRIVAHDAGDLTVTVEAGVTLGTLNEALAREQQWLPLDPPQPEGVTIGGLIAADRNGPLRLAYGKVRDMLIGIKFVNGDGQVLKGGGRVVKNVAGYDVPKLLIGSYGTLGVIVEASFKLRPLPARQTAFLCSMPSLGAAVAQGQALLGSGLDPCFVEALNATAAEMMGVGQSPVLLAGFAGTEAEVVSQTAQLARALPGVAEVHEDEMASVRKALCGFPQPLSEDALVARVSTVPSVLGGLLDRFEVEAHRRGLTLEIAAHAASGVAWCQLAGPLPLLEFELCADWMRVHGRAAGGWVVFEALPAELCGRVDPWGFSEPSERLMQGIKRSLDPAGIFSPGRFVGRI